MAKIELRGLQPKEGRLMPFFSPEEPYTCGCQGAKYRVYSPNTSLLPFVLSLPLKSIQAFSVNVVNAETGKVYVCLSSSQIPHKLYTVGSTYMFVYNGEDIPGLRLPDKFTYFITLLGFQSCPLVAVVDTSCLLKITLGNTNELYGLPYHRGWNQYIYLDAELNNYKWESYTIQDKDDLGRNTTTQARLEKVWTVNFYDLPEWVYQCLSTSSILDSIILTQGIFTVTSSKKRGGAELDKGIICERTVTLTIPDAEHDQTDGLCSAVDSWVDVDTELPADACNNDVWVETGRTRCIPVGTDSPCSPLPTFTASAECSSGSGNIFIRPTNVPEGDVVEFSIDNGSTFIPDGTFTRLPLGTYTVRTRLKSTGCLSAPVPLTIPCGGNGEEPAWENTGTAFCLQVDDTTADWENTGNNFCVTIFSDSSVFTNRAIADVCIEVQSNA